MTTDIQTKMECFEISIWDVVESHRDLSTDMKAEILESVFWLDTGTHDALVEASNFIKTVESREGKKISCLEEIAFNNNWIKKKNIVNAIKFYGNCDYSNYLKKLL